MCVKLITMVNILCIETATNICSVAIFCGQEMLAYAESDLENAHSKVLTVFIKKLLTDNSLLPNDIGYIAVSCGPGSYTGLRIGVSVAKGFCYGLNKPLIMIPSTEIIAQACISNININEGELICPMIDARRMEVYHNIYDKHLNEVGELEPHIITESSYAEMLESSVIHFCGNGAFKILDVINHNNARIHTDIFISAKYMYPLASKRIASKQFADLAYDEPIYLKEFMAKQPKPYFSKGKK